MVESINEPNLRVNDLVINNTWDVHKMNHLIGENLTREVVNSVGSLQQAQDTMIWLPDKNGLFSSKSAWDIIRMKFQKLDWSCWIWNKWIPKKVAICIWKATFNCLPVDVQIRKCGIPLVSCCNCCHGGHEEDLEHVINKGDFVMEVWKRVYAELGIHFIALQGWKERAQGLFNRASWHSQIGILYSMIPIVVIWQLWRRRYRARMEGTSESFSLVVGNIMYWLNHIASNVNKVKRLSCVDRALLSRFGVKIVELKKCSA
ncbi:uncharacterized protein LOC121235334 [Juglans microcarpa x Juglans regia]|uniref:uncharacterized protein LOC121235334 n=1 Tax=Juglans microcarpa x Juglans regia TaxID=2249226 RepID=UPI001B7F54ED|nr:uncharacterized protein LOC121235334 [Juglans microcarpa x Juglans regia]